MITLSTGRGGGGGDREEWDLLGVLYIQTDDAHLS